jgi:hypothetical protein
MFRPSTALAAAVVVSLFAGAHARADFIPWSYSSTLNSPVASDQGLASGVNTTGVATVQHTSGSQNGASVAFLQPYGSPSATFTNAALNVTFNLIDDNSGKSIALPFTGFFNGSLMNGGTNLKFNVGNPSAKTFNLGSNEYTVAFGLYSPPSPGQGGTVGVNVVVVPQGSTPPPGGPPVTEAPEPTSMVLAGLGLSALGLRSWLRRRFAPRRA